MVLTDEDFEKAKTPATEAFDIRAFVSADDIDFLYFDTPYYLAPSGKAGVKAYALLRDALEETGRVGVGTIVLRQREHLAALGRRPPEKMERRRAASTRRSGTRHRKAV